MTDAASPNHHSKRWPLWVRGLLGIAVALVLAAGVYALFMYAIISSMGSGKPLYEISAWLDLTDPSQVVLTVADQDGDEHFWDGILVRVLPLGADEWSPLAPTTSIKQWYGGYASYVLVADFPQQLAVGASIAVSIDTPWGHHWESPPIVLTGAY